MSIQSKVSSMYRFQLHKYNSNFGKVLSSNDIMKILASSGLKGDPIATLSHLNINFIIEFEVYTLCAKIH